MRDSTRGYLYAFLSAIMWSTLGPWARFGYGRGLSAGEMVFFRATSGAALALIWALLRQPEELWKARRSWPLLALCGLISVGGLYYLYFLTVEMTTVAVAAVLLYTAPVFVTLLSYFLFSEPLTARKVGALALATVGVLLVSGVFGGEGQLKPLAIATGIGAALTYAMYSIFGKYAVRGHSPIAVLPYVLIFGSLFTFGLLPPARLFTLSYSPLMWLYFVLGGLVGTFVPYLLYTYGLTWVPASRASIVTMVEPVAAALWGWWFLTESLSAVEMVGGALVLIGAGLIRTRRVSPAPGEKSDGLTNSFDR